MTERAVTKTWQILGLVECLEFVPLTDLHGFVLLFLWIIFHCTHPTCKRTFPTNGGHNKHWNSAHREVTQEPGDEDNKNFTYFCHPYLTGTFLYFLYFLHFLIFETICLLASPTDQSGITLPQHAPPPPPPPVPEAHTAESWFPFSDRVEFDFAHLHFVRLQSSAAEIKLALDMWAAQTLVIVDSCENQHLKLISAMRRNCKRLTVPTFLPSREIWPARPGGSTTTKFKRYCKMRISQDLVVLFYTVYYAESYRNLFLLTARSSPLSTSSTFWSQASFPSLSTTTVYPS